MYLDYLVNTPAIPLGAMWHPMPRIQCIDGATVSVQRGSHSYCTPRNDEGPWSHMEAGFPSHTPPPSWMKYCEARLSIRDKAKWYVFWLLKKPMFIATVFPYIPIYLIRHYITEHGGGRPTPESVMITGAIITPYAREYAEFIGAKFISSRRVGLTSMYLFEFRGEEITIGVISYRCYIEKNDTTYCLGPMKTLDEAITVLPELFYD